MNKEFLYQVDDKDYQVVITYKRIKNIHYRFDGEKFLVSAHRLTPMKLIKSGFSRDVNMDKVTRGRRAGFGNTTQKRADLVAAFGGD